jgi:hypothetical protein
VSTRFVGVANERRDRVAAREYAADDLAAGAAGGVDHCDGHHFSFRHGSISSGTYAGRQGFARQPW